MDPISIPAVLLALIDRGFTVYRLLATRQQEELLARNYGAFYCFSGRAALALDCFAV